MKKAALLITTLVILSLYTTVAMADEELIDYTNDKYHFTIKYPDRHWVEMNPPYKNSVWGISNDINSGLYVTVLDYNKKETSIWQVDMEAFATGFINGLKEKLPDSELIDVQKAQWADSPAFLITYKLKHPTMILYGTQYACIHDKKIYVITYESMESASPKTKKQLESIVKSFIFTDK